MSFKRLLKGLAFVVATAILMIVLARGAPPEQTLFWVAAFDAGHVPLFGLFSLAVLGLSLTLVPTSGRRRLWHYGIALVVGLGVGLITELLQFFGPRDADLYDFLRDAAGVVSFLLVVLTFDRGIAADETPGRVPGAWTLRIVGVLLLLAAVGRVPLLTLAYLQRWHAAPLLCSFEARWETVFVRLTDAELEPVPPPAGWPVGSGERIGKVTFHPAIYPSFHIREPYPDWTGYERLVFTIGRVRPGSRIRLMLRIDDIHHNRMYSDRFNRELVLSEEQQTFSIPLSEIRNAPEGREMDMRRVRRMLFYGVRPMRSCSLYFSDIRLE